ncbi:hypothetical protein SB4_15445 [Sphingomonas sanguinis]|uniref:Uncharacterized protein n=1 Tax=Sphingomonas sanguinis TaxID=33051 RepID=A0A147IMJ0_9SPHN|nr:hypothetical protein SB4_15445 [Sphingomonas sanguinis]
MTALRYSTTFGAVPAGMRETAQQRWQLSEFPSASSPRSGRMRRVRRLRLTWQTRVLTHHISSTALGLRAVQYIFRWQPIVTSCCSTEGQTTT